MRIAGFLLRGRDPLNAYPLNAYEPLATTASYAYDPAGNLASITDPRANTTSFTYDALGRMAQINQLLSKQTGFTYDANGNLSSRTTAENTLVYAYDDANRLSAVSEGPTALRAYTYDNAGRITDATDASGHTIEIGYDADDHPTSVDDGRGFTQALAYNSRGLLVSQVDRRGTVGYAYDSLGQMDLLTDPDGNPIDYSYDPEGNLTGVDLPNGVTTTNAYDAVGRMTRTTSATATATLQDFTYVYDANGNRTRSTDRTGAVTTYDYDQLNRLVNFDGPSDPAVTYAYDAAGNRTRAGDETFVYDALNRLVRSSFGRTFSYDEAGRLTNQSTTYSVTDYTYDALDQLRTVDATDTGSVAGAPAQIIGGLTGGGGGGGSTPVSHPPIDYTYDAFGRRSERTEGSSSQIVHFSGLSDIAVADTGSSGATSAEYFQGPGGLVEQSDGSATSFPLADAHGDVTTLTDASGGVGSRQAYDPWGVQSSGPELPMGWLGAYERRGDPGLGLVQVGVRQYAPGLGRFTSEDVVVASIGLGQSTDRQTYAVGNPIRFFDLDGRSVGEDVGDFVSSWWDDPTNFGDPREMIAPAQEEWVRSDSSIAPFAGSVVSMVDVAVNPDRMDHYMSHNPYRDTPLLSVAVDCIQGMQGSVGRAGQEAARIPRNVIIGGTFAWGYSSASDLEHLRSRLEIGLASSAFARRAVGTLGAGIPGVGCAAGAAGGAVGRGGF